MTTIPARLAKSVKLATTPEEARIRVIDAYRHWYRSAPEICALYALNVSPSTIRLKIREDFEKVRNVSDLKVINVLLHKNWVEYQETMNCWKQEVSASERCEEEPRCGMALTLAPPHALVQAARGACQAPDVHGEVSGLSADTEPRSGRTGVDRGGRWIARCRVGAIRRRVDASEGVRDSCIPSWVRSSPCYDVRAA